VFVNNIIEVWGEHPVVTKGVWRRGHGLLRRMRFLLIISRKMVGMGAGGLSLSLQVWTFSFYSLVKLEETLFLPSEVNVDFAFLTVLT
jgi:hypothetical protein